MAYAFEAMVVTAVDIPDKLLKFIDGLVSQETARNWREVIMAALRIIHRLRGYSD